MPASPHDCSKGRQPSPNVAGKVVVMPFSQMCSNLQLVGNLMVGFCMFVAALIVFRS